MLRQVPLTAIKGFFMGAADLVPGVSGGTVALVFGIYGRLVAAIKTGSSALGRLLKLDLRGFVDGLKAVEWIFLAPLLAGILIAVLALAGLLEHLLTEYPIQMASLFFGLILGSIVVAWQLLRTRDGKRLVIMVVTALVVFWLLGLRGGTTEETVGQLESPQTWAFFLAGAVAICAMILPGISGSFILVLLGMYGPVLAAVNDRDLATLTVFVIGTIIGLALFSQVLSWALARYYDSVMATLIGLMAGSLRVLWPWPDGLDGTSLGAPNESVWQAVAIAAVAFLAVAGVSLMARRLGQRTDLEESAELGRWA